VVTFQTQNGLLTLVFAQNQQPTLGGLTGFAPEQQASFPSDIARAYAAAFKAPPPSPFDQRWSAWGSAFGGISRISGDSASAGVTANAYGFSGGMNYYATADTVWGFALAGGGTHWNVAQGFASGRSVVFQAGVYGMTRMGPAYVSAGLIFANNWFTTNRIATGDQITASFVGQGYAARGEAGYRYAVPFNSTIVGITPYGALQPQLFHTPSYSEIDRTGGGLGINFAVMTATDIRSELGLRFDNLQIINRMPVILRARAAWAHDWVSHSSLTAAFAVLPGASFIVNGLTLPKDSALATAEAELHLTANWDLLVKLDGGFSDGSQIYAGTGTLRYAW